MHPDFSRLYDTEKRYVFITGGRGSLKSANVHEYIGELCRWQKGHGVLFTRYTMKSAEKSIIPEFKIVTAREGYVNEFDIKKNIVTHKKTGSFIVFSGIKTSSGNQTENLKSIAGITTWVIEEGEGFRSEKTFDTIDDSIRTATMPNKVIWIQNPTTKEHFIYKRWIEPKSRQINVRGFDVTVSDLDNVEHIHTTYHIAEKYLSKDWLTKAQSFYEKIKDSDYATRQTSWYYYNYIGGWLEKSEGVIYPNWRRGYFDESLPYGYGLDLGYNPDPLAMVRGAIDSKNKLFYVSEEVYKTNLSTELVKEIVKDRLKKSRDLVMADTNEPRLISELSAAKINIQKATKGPDSVRSGIRSINDYQIIVCGDSPNLIIELNHYVWNDKKSSTPIGEYNHLMDAMRYIFDRLNPNRKTIKMSKGKYRR